MEKNKSDLGLFAQYADVLLSGDVVQQHGLDERLLIAEEGELSVYYSPFDYVERRARIVLVGITPGLVQAKNAWREASLQLRNGASYENAIYHAKVAASFSGSMRRNLVDLLDGVGINKWLGLISAADLFSTHSNLVHYTSVLRYPVFRRGENYSGNPAPQRSLMLQSQIEQWFLRELEILTEAVFIPLGAVPRQVLAEAVRKGLITEEQVLDGLPHPSGANAERIAYFLGRKAATDCSSKCDVVKLDHARASVLSKISTLQPVIC